MKRNVFAITDGTAQDKRLADGLRDHYFDVEERSFADMMMGSADLARTIRYYDALNQPKGAWTGLFESDELMVLADIVSTDTARMEAEFLERQSDLYESAMYLLMFARHIDRWHERLVAFDDGTAQTMRGQIEAVVKTKLRDAMRTAVTILRAAPRMHIIARTPAETVLTELHAMWFAGNPGLSGGYSIQNWQQAQTALKLAFYAMISAVVYLKPVAEECMKQSEVSGDHDPAAALLIAFIRLLRNAQDKLNQFSARHRDFYYGDVLKMRPSPQQLDATFLVFTPNVGGRPLWIPAGTQFTAGKIGGTGEILYESTAPLLVTDARIEHIHTLYRSRRQTVSPEWELGYVDGLRFREVPLQVKDADAQKTASSWPIFGAPGANDDVPSASDATVGFAIASPSLRLSEGERSITVTIHFRLPQSSTESKPLFRNDFRSLIFDHQSIRDKIGAFSEQTRSFRAQVEELRNQAGAVRDAELRKHSTSMLGSAVPAEKDFANLIDQASEFSRDVLDLKDNLYRGISSMDEAIAQLEVGIDALAGGYSAGRENTATPQQFASFRTRLESFRSFLATLKIRIKNFLAQAAKLGFEANDLLLQDPDYVFHVVMGSVFRVSITAEKGWYRFPTYRVSMPASDALGEIRIAFDFAIGPEGPQVVPHNSKLHGAGFADDAPLLRFCLNPQAMVYGYSLFEDLSVQSIDIDVAVKDATHVVAWNQFGQLDTSKPFVPFGPLPTTSSYLIVGNYESALMNLTEFRLQIEWGDLPTLAGGFRQYYRGYDAELSNDSFLVRQTALRDGRWRPLPDENTFLSRLFQGHKEGPVESDAEISFDVLHWFKPMDAATRPEEFRYDQRTRSGFFRLELAAPSCAFGHRDYPQLITAAVTAHARRKQASFQPPNAPYTPTIRRVLLSYKASSSIRVGSGTSAVDRFYQIHPWGTEIILVANAWKLLPTIDCDGNLLIGFSSGQAAETLTLLFHLREDSATAISSEQEPVTWWYLVSNTWRRLDESSVASDTTNGFLSSGIVVLHLPSEMDSNSTTMPGSCYWIRASIQSIGTPRCSAYTIRAQSVPVIRKLTAAAPAVCGSPLAAGSIRGPVTSIAGLRAVEQPIASTGGREQESAPHMIARTAERLRHKGRAVTPWDYERIVLEGFPGVFKVKCFAAMTSSNPTLPSPGSVLIVAVPYPTDYQAQKSCAPMLNANQLAAIRDYVSARCSPQVRIEVRNPAYERILVRCSVVFRQPGAAGGQHTNRGEGRGYWLRQLNQDIVDYLSPWSSIGPPPRFGWSFQVEEVQAYVRGLPYVGVVTGFSMLHLTKSDQDVYLLEDSARPEGGAMQADGAAIGTQKMVPRYPWSLAIPNSRNILEILEGDNETEIAAQPTGIGSLCIGDIFTVRGTKQ